ncbi:hypothetical protein KAX17_15135, partial [Candidatus Bipolaricaulota bacterium]|nr:hypothetical protein [Candidatus Bipolaricaulota bacterium]
MASTLRVALYLKTILADLLPKAEAGREAYCELLSRIARLARPRLTQRTSKGRRRSFGSRRSVRDCPPTHALCLLSQHDLDSVLVLKPVGRDEVVGKRFAVQREGLHAAADVVRVANFNLEHFPAEKSGRCEVVPRARDARIDAEAADLGAKSQDVPCGAEVGPGSGAGQPRRARVPRTRGEGRVRSLALHVRLDLADLGALVVRCRHRGSIVLVGPIAVAEEALGDHAPALRALDDGA